MARGNWRNWAARNGAESPKKTRVKKPERIDPNTFESEHMQIIPACGTFGHDRIVKEIAEELSKRGCKEVKVRKD